MSTTSTLTLAGLPPLTWERGTGWGCEANLPAWAGFTPRFTADQPPGAGPPTTSLVPVTFESADVHARTPPSAAQQAAFQRLIADGEAVRDEILRQAFHEFADSLREDPEIVGALGGPLAEPSQFSKLIALISVHIGVETADGETPVDLDFDCVWDPEHGFMAILAGGRVTYVGPR